MRDDNMQIIYYLLLLGLVGSGIFIRYRGNLPHALKQVGLWLVIILAIVLGYSFRTPLTELKNRLASELSPSSGIQIAERTMEFRKSSDGHFYIDATIDGTKTTFMLDTGASDVVIPLSLARSMGIDINKLNFNKLYRTANGTVRGAAFTIKEFRIGNIVINDVRASVNSANMSTSLLGMSFLEKIKGYEIRNGTAIFYFGEEAN